MRMKLDLTNTGRNSKIQSDRYDEKSQIDTQNTKKTRLPRKNLDMTGFLSRYYFTAS